MRIMAIDYGDAHTGIAISDPTGFLTGTTTTIHSRKAEEVAGEIARLVQEHGVEELVMGYPRNMDGTEGPRAELYRDFAALVEDTAGLRPVLWDERRTTVDAHRILFEAGKNARKQKKDGGCGGGLPDFGGISGSQKAAGLRRPLSPLYYGQKKGE